MDSIETLTRRRALGALGQGTLALSFTGALATQAHAGTTTPALPVQGALSNLARTLSTAPRRRGFQSVPFILDEKRFWDHEAADALLSYTAPHQMWEVTDLGGPWLNLMRESVNGQVFAHGHKDFLEIGAVHGGAHFALFSQVGWDKYKLASKTDGKFASNVLIVERTGVSPSDDIQNLDGFYGPNNNNIVTLQRRGMVFVACHDSIHAIARGLHAAAEFSGTSANEIAADLTNSLLPGVVLVPSVVAFMAELQRSGYSYAKGS